MLSFVAFPLVAEGRVLGALNGCTVLQESLAELEVTVRQAIEFFERWLPDDAKGQPEGEAPVRIFVMGGGSGRKTAASRTLKIAVLAPIPNARVSTAAAVKLGCRASSRKP